MVTPGFRPPGFEAPVPVRAIRIGSYPRSALQLLSDQRGQEREELGLG